MIVDLDEPMGPGWFIFFRPVVLESSGKGGSAERREAELLDDDEELLELILGILPCLP